SLYLILDMPVDRIGTIAARITYRYASTWELAAIPMFIWMGEIIFRTDISDRLFRGLAPFADKIPGRLLHTNVLGCTLFAAVSGSSAATTATVGKITMAEFARRGYDRNLALGSLAGAGSLGLLIPPSIMMIVYGVLAEVSISRLFAAGMIPGLMIAGIYSVYVIIYSLFRPSVAPADSHAPGFRDMITGVCNLAPIGILIGVVLGAIYSGLATPSETAAIGVAVTLIYAACTWQLSWDTFISSLTAAVHTSCMIAAIMVGAAFLSTAMGFMHVPHKIAAVIDGLELSPYQLIFILVLFYLLLGMFLEGISMMVMSLPITLPLIVAAGFDPIWFGIFLILMAELAQITPPVGFNLFILQDLTRASIGRIILACVPFFFLMCLGVALITVFPQIVLWLPDYLFSK